MSLDDLMAIYKRSDEDAALLMRGWHASSETWASLFLSIDNAELRKIAMDNDNLPDFANYLIWVYQNTVFFPNDSLSNEYQLLGIRNHALRWYTSLSEITKLLPQASCDGNFLIKTDLLFTNIKMYLDSKIWDSVLQDFGFTGKVYRRETNLSETSLHKYLLRSKARKSFATTVFDLDIEPLLAKISTTNLPFAKDQKSLKQIAGGNTESMFIKKAFNEYIVPNPESLASETNIMQKCRGFFDLAKLVMKDEDLADEETFLTFRGKYSKYDGDYNDYKGKRIYKLLVE